MKSSIMGESRNFKQGWLVYLVSSLACNTRVIVDANSNPPIFRVKIVVTKSAIKSFRKQKLTLTFHHQSIKW